MSGAHHDVIIAGLGGAGSATACHLALRGRRVLGLERWFPGHTFGSSHGDSRIIREAYFEHPMYVPMVRRAYALWRELEERTGHPLLRETGGLMIGPRTGELVSGTLRSAAECDLPIEVFSADQMHARFPAFRLRNNDIAVFDPRAGYLAPEDCIAAHCDVARAHGAELRFEEQMIAWEAAGDGVRVRTSRQVYSADQLVIAVGARLPAFVADLGLPLAVERQVLFWFQPDVADLRYDPVSFPIFIHEGEQGMMCYGFPRLHSGVKASIFHRGAMVSDADAIERTVADQEVEPLRRALAAVVPGLASAPLRDAAVCMFTNTPDLNFVIGFHPAHPQVLISSACSGHGFKFASAIGEIQAELLTEDRSQLDVSWLGIDRFQG